MVFFTCWNFLQIACRLIMDITFFAGRNFVLEKFCGLDIMGSQFCLLAISKKICKLYFRIRILSTCGL